MSKNISKFLREFLEYLEIKKNRSQKTIENYNFYLNRFIEWLGDKGLESITEKNIQKYRLWLGRLVDIHDEHLKKNTQNYHLIALRSFLKYLTKKNIKTLSPKKIELMPMPSRKLTFIDGSDLNRLLEAPIMCEITKNTKLRNEKNSANLIKYRDKAILELLFNTGLRVSELSNLKKENINIKKETLTITTKEKKLRTISLSKQAKYWLKKYLNTRKDKNPYLFISQDKRNIIYSSDSVEQTKKSRDSKPITPRSIQRLVQKYAKAAGITKSITPHTLRHSYAIQTIKNGSTAKDLQDKLDHSSLTAIKKYLDIANKKL